MICDTCIHKPVCMTFNKTRTLEEAENMKCDYFETTKKSTVDAVPVVRCKDCKKWQKDGAYEYDIDGTKRMWGSCSNSLHHCKDNHFCSYGRRKEE